jgi:type I restriction enzyme S subunit
MATNQGCKTLIPGSDLDFRYLYYCLLVRRRMLDELGTGATFRELSAGKLREVEIPVPSLDDQTRVVGLLDQLTDGIALGRSSAQARLDRARALRQSVLETAFRGEL